MKFRIRECKSYSQYRDGSETLWKHWFEIDVDSGWFGRWKPVTFLDGCMYDMWETVRQWDTKEKAQAYIDRELGKSIGGRKECKIVEEISG